MPNLLIIFHSKSGSTSKMANAVLQGTNHPDIDTKVRMITAFDAVLEDLLWADGLILGTPENFGYMSGALKDFLDRVFYPAEGKVEGLPYAIFVSASNDGTGAVTSIQRICKGFPLKEVQEAVISKGDVTHDVLEKCEQLGLYMAAGVEGGIF